MIGVGVSLRHLRGSVAAIGGLLDKFTGAAAAYSLRALSVDTTNVVRVRRDSDNAEADFTATEVGDGTLTAWVGAGNDGLVTTWYDQSGNSNDATQATAASQPKIVDAGALVTDGANPSIDFPDPTYLTSASPLSQLYEDYFLSIVAKFGTRVNANPRYLGNRIAASGENTLDSVFGYNANDRFFSRVNDTTYGTSVYTAEGVLMVNSHYAVGTDQFISHNGQAEDVDALGEPPNATSLMPSTGFHIGAGYKPDRFRITGNISEVIVYETDQSANRVAIEQNIASHYGITLA